MAASVTCPGSNQVPTEYVTYVQGADIRTEPVAGQYDPRKRAKCPCCWSIRWGRQSDGLFPNHAPRAK
jgi:hypothetical protein